MMTNLFLKNSIRWLIYAALAVPLLFSVYFYPSHAAPQTFLFRLIVEVMAVLWVALLLRDSSFLPRSTPLLWAFGAFIGASVLSAALGADPYRSFFSDFERHWGVVTLAHIFLFFVIAASVFRDPASWRLFFMVSAGVSALVALYGTYQFFFLEEGRAYSTIGNAGFLANYLLLNAVLALFLYSEKEKARWLWGGVVVVNAAAALMTGTRGATVALFAGIAVLCVAALFSRFFAQNRKNRMFVVVAAALVLFGALLVLVNSEAVRQSDVGRALHISFSDTTANTRLLAWRAGMEGFLDHPLFGSGPELFGMSLNTHFPPEFYTYVSTETGFDRAHNVFVEQLVVAGAFGLLAYLSLFGALLWEGRRRVLAYVFVAVYAAQGFFGIDVLTSFVPLALVMGYFAAHLAGNPISRVTERRDGLQSALTIGLVAVAGCAVAWTVNVKPLAANMAFSDAHAVRQDIGSLDAKEAIDSAQARYQKALGKNSYGNETIRESLVAFTLDAYRTFGRNAEGFKDSLLPFALKQARVNIAEHPYNYFYYYHLARLYTIHIVLGGTADETTERLAAQGETWGPERLELPFAFSQLALVKGDFDGAIARADAGIEKNKQFADFYRVAFLAYNLKGDPEHARRYLEEGAAHGLELSSSEKQFLTNESR